MGLSSFADDKEEDEKSYRGFSFLCKFYVMMYKFAYVIKIYFPDVVKN